MRSMRILILERSERTLVLPLGRMANVVGQLMLFFFYKHEDFSSCEARILILDFFYSLREAYYKGERTLVLPSGRSVAFMRSMRILILERSERSVALMRSLRTVGLNCLFNL